MTMLGRIATALAFPLVVAAGIDVGLAQSGASGHAPELPRVRVEVPAIIAQGRTIRVAADGNLQEAIDEAKPGDTISLEPRATYRGPFRLRKKNGDGWIVIASAARDLPLPGRRVTLADAAKMPNLVASSGSVFETEPGAQAQADWGQVRVLLGSQIVEVHIFVMTLGYSRRAWAEGYGHERMESLLAAHEHGFEHFGGVTREILYDRMRTVIQGEREGTKRWNPTFQAFARHWGFEPRACRPYRAQTKGKVESGVKYVKRNFLPGRVFRDLEDFNEQLAGWLAEVADLRIHGTTHELPIERFAREADLLARTREQPSFLQAMRRERVVAEDWLVSIDANRYSVPWRLIGKTVQVVRVGASWQILHQGELVAEHPMLAGRHQLRVNPAHGPGAVARNARKRFAEAPAAPAVDLKAHALLGVEVRDLAVYDELLEAA